MYSRPKNSLLKTLTPNRQQGFAPIALVVLLLFGIATGTLLIQSGTNFLPKAANYQTYECDTTGNLIGKSEEFDESGPTGYRRDVIKNCISLGLICNATLKDCTAPLGEESCKRLYGSEYRVSKGKCVHFSALSDQTDSQLTCAQKCTKVGYLGGCDSNYHCLYDPQQAGKPCPEFAVNKCVQNKQLNTCIVQSVNNGIGDEKCYYSTNQKECTKADKEYCANNTNGKTICKPIYGDPKLAYECYPSNNQGTPTRLAPQSAPATAPDPTNPRPAAGGESAPATRPASTVTGCESLKDTDGLTIPCYKIGVFTPDDLKATEGQAKVALDRYTQYRRIITEAGDKLDSAIKAKAEEKIKEAERLANACIARQ